jgi:hypothetical protein
MFAIKIDYANKKFVVYASPNGMMDRKRANGFATLWAEQRGWAVETDPEPEPEAVEA